MNKFESHWKRSGMHIKTDRSAKVNYKAKLCGNRAENCVSCAGRDCKLCGRDQECMILLEGEEVNNRTVIQFTIQIKGNIGGGTICWENN